MYKMESTVVDSIHLWEGTQQAFVCTSGKVTVKVCDNLPDAVETAQRIAEASGGDVAVWSGAQMLGIALAQGAYLSIRRVRGLFGF